MCIVENLGVFGNCIIFKIIYDHDIASGREEMCKETK